MNAKGVIESEANHTGSSFPPACSDMLVPEFPKNLEAFLQLQWLWQRLSGLAVEQCPQNQRERLN